MKVAVFIDGGYLRVLVKQTGFAYTPEYIEQTAHACLKKDEESLLRVLYYDCLPYTGTLTLPVSGQTQTYRPDTRWFEDLAAKPQFAVRKGILKFRGFRLTKKRVATNPRDEDFRPRFEQKGVDMRLGLDIAHYANTRSVDRIILISGDTDCLPAMKVARMAGLQVVLIQFPHEKLARELLWRSDFCRAIAWPRQ